MQNEYVKLIKELDKTLSIIRALLLESKTPDEKAQWRGRIDELLDERLRLMKSRDAVGISIAV